LKARIPTFSILAVALLLLAAPVCASSNNNAPADIRGSSAASVRRFPDTTRGIHIFTDQLSTVMSEDQLRFAATHYAGTQKMLRVDADRLRTVNPSFVILHYRLGLGLGYRAAGNGCQPVGDWLGIIEGNDWVREYPDTAQEGWFYHYPEGGATRVYNCDWGWYLMNLDDDAWRSYWHDEVLRQIQANDDDGVFMDSLSVPNYMGYDHFKPSLPALDEQFESAWSERISDWLSWLQTQPVGDYYIVPNVGSWITSRDQTDYSPADGVMVEGFAIEADDSPYPYSDWQLQMNRVLGLVTREKVVIGQSYATGDQERMFALGSYLLVKGSRTYLTVELSEEPEWYPEYGIPIGAPTQTAGSDIANLYDPASHTYRRNFDNGFVIVNAQDQSGTSATINLGGTFYLAKVSGGGLVTSSGTTTGKVTYEAVTRITLPPYSAALLFNSIPTQTATTSTTTASAHTTLSSTTTSTTSASSSPQTSQTTAAASQEPIPGFPIEAVLLGAILGVFLLFYRRSRRSQEDRRP